MTNTKKRWAWVVDNSVFAFHSNNMSSNIAEIYSLYSAKLSEKSKNYLTWSRICFINKEIGNYAHELTMN